MSDKSTVLKTFNTQFFAFLEDVKTIFPENKDVASAKKSFELIKMANPSIIIKVWYSYIYTPYHEEIEKGNIDFAVTMCQKSGYDYFGTHFGNNTYYKSNITDEKIGDAVLPKSCPKFDTMTPPNAKARPEIAFESNVNILFLFSPSVSIV